MSPVAKYWNGSAWATLGGVPVYEQPDQPTEPVAVGAVWIDTDAPTPAATAKLLNVQRILGGGSGYIGIGNGNRFVVAGGGLLQVSYTPPVDAWWEVNLHVGLLQCLTASYVLAQPAIQMTSPSADVDGFSLVYDYRTMHSGVQLYESFDLVALFKLAAGVAYTVATVFVCSGAYQYYQASEQLHMHAKAWTR